MKIGFVFANSLFVAVWVVASLCVAITPALMAQAQPPTSAPAPATPPAPAATQIVSPELRELSKTGDTQVQAKNYDAAMATYRSLLDQLTGPLEKADVLSRIAEVHRRKGDIAESLRALEQALVLVPTNPSLLLSIGMVYEAQKDPAHARESYEKAVRLEPNNPLILNNLAYLLSNSFNELDRALSYAVAARRVLPREMAITDTIGWIYLKKNMPAIAAEQFRTASTNSPTNPEYHYHYAIALNRQNDPVAAAKECEAALANTQDPAFQTAIRRECAPRPPAAR